MSVSVGGLGAVSLRSPARELVNIILGKADLQSVFCAVVCFLVFLILAYLTNPSESSFRAYLTEQSFRQHLSRLDDNLDESTSSSSQVLSNGKHNSTAAVDPFHFANRASVSLRTPKHVFHSFGIFTIAAVVPLSTDSAQRDRDGSMVSDSWFLGAFGKWWRGGTLEAWYHDVISHSKDEESWTSGILAFKPSDKQSELGLPFPNKASVPLKPTSRGTPPKLRHRDPSAQRSSHPRDSSPPPLPKSASLPLHSTGQNASFPGHATPPVQAPLHSNTTNLAPVAPVNLSSPVPSHPPSVLFEQSPQIIQVLRQISATKASVSELQTQLADAQAMAELSRTQLTSEIEVCRERKRSEDSSRSELKSRTKALEDSKRAAENTRRDAEKRLKAAQSARDDATRRMDHLDLEIEALQRRLVHAPTALIAQKDDRERQIQEVSEALESKKKEIKVAEDVIAALNLRARELEDKIAAQKDALRLAREQAEQMKQERLLANNTNQPQLNSPITACKWSPLSFAKDPDFRVRKHSGSERDDNSQALLQTGFRPDADQTPLQPSVLQRSKGYSIFNDDLAAHPVPPHRSITTFAPFDDVEPETPPRPVHLQPPTAAPLSTGMISPTSSALIPTSLVSYFDRMDSSDLVARSFQSENDVYLDREWRSKGHSAPGQPVGPKMDMSKSTGFSDISSSSNSSLHTNPYGGEFDPFEVRVMHHHHGYGSGSLVESIEGTTPELTLHRTNSDPSANQYSDEDSSLASYSFPRNDSNDNNNTQGLKSVFSNTGPRRWFSTREKSTTKKGLDPNAKAFNFSRKSFPLTSNERPSAAPAPAAFEYDALNPTGRMPTSLTTTSSSLLRAFAPSPAEREVLQRVLGGSSNGSLERLPSLSDVGSIPSSPQQLHQHLPEHADGVATLGMMSKGLPAWLHSLPRIRKPQTSAFSPWDDDEDGNDQREMVERN